MGKNSLMGLTIAVGFVVNEAIVMLETIYRHLKADMSRFAAAVKGAGEIGLDGAGPCYL